jgi:prepilin-type N-terminal cleavage/methylation domain-containing protein
VNLRPGRTRRRAAGSPGFTLIEVLVATAVAAILGAVLLSMYLGYVHTLQRADTARRLQVLRDGFAAFYRNNTFLVEIDAGPSFHTGAQTQIASGAELQAADMPPIAAYLPRAAPVDAYRDGYGQPIQLLVSERRFQNVDGVSIAYRRLAFVSAGPNGRFESGNWEPAQAQIERGGDDELLVLDTWADQADLFRRTDQRMQKLAEVTRAYAQGRYLLDPNRDPLIDYFGRSTTPGGDASGESDRFDPGNELARTSTKLDGTLSDAELAALQLTREDATSAWSQALQLENDTDSVRSPEHAPPDNFPPYTARIVVAMPGRVAYQQLIIGAF